MAKILLTGGSGFLGRNLVPELLSAGHELTNLAPKNYEGIPNIHFDAFKDDLKDKLKGHSFDVIIHMAALSTPKLAQDREKTMTLNVQMTKDLLDFASRQKKLTHFFFFSTALVYADEAPRPLKTSAKLQANKDDFYTESKIKAEEICQEYQAKGLPIQIWRLTNCFGPYQPHAPHPNLIPQVMKQAIEEKKVTILNGSYTRDFLYSKDLAKLLTQAIDQKSSDKILNVATGTPHSVQEIAQVISKELQAPIIDKKISLNKASDLTLDITRLKERFPNFKFTPFDQALRESLAYYIHIV